MLRVHNSARRIALALVLALPLVMWSPGALSDDHLASARLPADEPAPSPTFTPYVHRSKAVVYGRPHAPTPTAPVATARPPAPVPSRTELAPGTKTALIVGINHEDASDPLEGAVKDAENVRDALFKFGFRRENVTVLLERDATRPRILSELRRLAERTPPSGLAAFAAASHGGRGQRGYSFRTAEGSRVYASEVADHLKAVRAPVWTLLAMCYAGGWTAPGITGTNRVATFASRADQYTYEKGKNGSTLVIEMVERGMIEGRADGSVEQAFAFARSRMTETESRSEPVISDGFRGDLVLQG